MQLTKEGDRLVVTLNDQQLPREVPVDAFSLSEQQNSISGLECHMGQEKVVLPSNGARQNRLAVQQVLHQGQVDTASI